MMDSRKNVLFVGPVPPPTTGQSFAFQQVYEAYDGPKQLINLNYTLASSLKKLYVLLSSFLRVFIAALTNKNIEVAYLPCAFTRAGNLRDIIIINTLVLFNIKIVNHVHGAGFHNMLITLPPLQQKMAIRTFRKVHTSIVLMAAMQREFYSFKDTMQLRVIENFYDPAIDNFQPSHSPTKKTIDLIYFSNLMSTKGILLLLEAFDQLIEQYPQLRLHIAGHILDDREMSKQKVSAYLKQHLEKHETTKYYGLVQGEEKARFLHRGDIFILPTFYFLEAFPISIIEAMRCGNAIITTRHNYLEHIVASEQGTLIEPRSAQAIYQAVEHYIQHPDQLKQQQHYNTNYAQKHYTLDNFIRKVVHIFDTV